MNPALTLLLQLAPAILAATPVLAILWRLGDQEPDA